MNLIDPPRQPDLICKFDEEDEQDSYSLYIWVTKFTDDNNAEFLFRNRGYLNDGSTARDDMSTILLVDGKLFFSHDDEPVYPADYNDFGDIDSEIMMKEFGMYLALKTLESEVFDGN